MLVLWSFLFCFVSKRRYPPIKDSHFLFLPSLLPSPFSSEYPPLSPTALPVTRTDPFSFPLPPQLMPRSIMLPAVVKGVLGCEHLKSVVLIWFGRSAGRSQTESSKLS